MIPFHERKGAKSHSPRKTPQEGRIKLNAAPETIRTSNARAAAAAFDSTKPQADPEQKDQWDHFLLFLPRMTECSVDFYLGASSHPAAAAPFQAAKTDTHAAIMTLLRSTRSFARAAPLPPPEGSAETNNLTQCHPSLNEEEAHAFQPNAERRRVYLYPKSNSNATFFILTAEAECAFKTDN